MTRYVYVKHEEKESFEKSLQKSSFLATKSYQQCILYKDIKWLVANSTNVFMHQTITSSIAIPELVYGTFCGPRTSVYFILLYY